MKQIKKTIYNIDKVYYNAWALGRITLYEMLDKSESKNFYNNLNMVKYVDNLREKYPQNKIFRVLKYDGQIIENKFI